jgi:hypothetical protein
VSLLCLNSAGGLDGVEAMVPSIIDKSFNEITLDSKVREIVLSYFVEVD